MNDNAKIVAATLAGLAIGAIVGVLFAPEKGSLTWNKLTGKFKDSGIVNDSVEMNHHEEFEESLNEAVKHGKLKRPAAEKLRETLDKLTENGSHAPNNISGLTGSN